MKITIIAFLGTALLAGPATAAPAPVHDRIADLCAVSNTDLEGQRLARACRAELRARAEAERIAAAPASQLPRAADLTPERPLRTAEAVPLRPR
nr:hypothetical protein [uncultured Sphingomonas sp.]